MKKLLTPASFAAAKWTAKQRSFGTIFQTSTEKKRDHHLLFQGPFASFPKIYFCLLLFFPDRDVGDGSFITIHQHIDYVSQKTRENKRTNMVCFYTRENRSCCCREDGKMTFPSFSFFPCYISYMLSSAKNS